MRVYKPEHPAWKRDIVNVFEYGSGRQLRSDAHGDIATSTASGKRKANTGNPSPRELPTKKIKCDPSSNHSVLLLKSGVCCYKKCPGRNRTENLRVRCWVSQHHCEECTSRDGTGKIFICVTARRMESYFNAIENITKRNVTAIAKRIVTMTEQYILLSKPAPLFPADYSYIQITYVRYIFDLNRKMFYSVSLRVQLD